MHALALGATLLTLATTHAPVTAVALDGPRVAWATASGVYTRLLPNGRTVQLAATHDATEVAVAGHRVAWASRGSIGFAAARAGAAVPRARTFTGVVSGLVGGGSLLGFTVVSLSTEPGTCDEDNACTGSMQGSSVGYVVRGSTVSALANGVQPRSLLPPAPTPPHARIPAGAQVYPTTRGALVVAGRTLFVVTPRVPNLVEIGSTSGLAGSFTVSGARVVWTETLDARHARVRAVVLH